ncbi:hypothetical protein Tco_0663425 [Tanacetum coccineum]
MVTIPIRQASSSIPPLSTSIINLSPPKPVLPLVQEHIFSTTTLLPPPPLPPQSTTDPDLATRIFALEKRSADLEKKNQLQEKTTQALASRVYKLEHHDLYSKIEKKSMRSSKKLFTTLSKLHFSRKRRCDNQDPPPSPPKDSNRSKKKKHDYDISASKQPLPINDDPIQEDLNLSESEDSGASHLPKIKTRPDWFKPLPEEETPETPKPDWVIPLNELPKTENNWADALAKTRHALSISKLKAAYYPDFRLKELVLSLWTGSKSAYEISLAYGISHWWFKRKEFYITRHSAPSDRNAVRSHMRILSVVSLKTFSRYGYTFLKEIVLQRVDYKEYKISESDFKNLHPNDFEDMYLLHL